MTNRKIVTNHPCKAKKILQNFQDVENKSSCSGEALLLDGRINQCLAAVTLADLEGGSSNPSWEELLGALSLVKEHWHHIPLALKAKLAEKNIVVQMQDFSEQQDNDKLDSIVDCLLPFSCGVEASSFDGSNPTLHGTMGDLIFIIAKFDLESADPDADPTEEEIPYRSAAKAPWVWALSVTVSNCNNCNL